MFLVTRNYCYCLRLKKSWTLELMLLLDYMVGDFWYEIVEIERTLYTYYIPIIYLQYKLFTYEYIFHLYTHKYNTLQYFGSLILMY
jgi:hypothetical protein